MGDTQLTYNRRNFARVCGATAGAAAFSSSLSLWGQQAASNPVVVENPLLMLVRDQKVHQELKLQPRQAAAIQVATDAVDPAYFLMRDWTVAQRTEKSKPLIARVQAQLDQTLERSQKQRLNQIVAQAQGHRALLQDDIARVMRFSGSQRNQLTEIARATEEEKQELTQKGKSAGTARDKIQQQITELMQNEQKQFVDVLSMQQKRLISTVFGPTFERNRNQLPHFKPPRLPLPGPWLNSEPLTLEALKGKVVALHFYAFA